MNEQTSTTPIILLIEDSDEDYVAFGRALQGAAVAVSLYRCTRGDEALAYLHRRGHVAGAASAPRPALILLDLNLPGMDGRELLAALKTDTALRSTPIVIVTTSHNPHDIAWCYQHGANAYHAKAMDYAQFRDEIRLLVEYWLRVCLLPHSATGASAPTAAARAPGSQPG